MLRHQRIRASLILALVLPSTHSVRSSERGLDLPAYRELVDRYCQDDSAGALSELDRWSPEDLNRVLRELRRFEGRFDEHVIRDTLPGWDIHKVSTAAMLSLSAGIANRTARPDRRDYFLWFCLQLLRLADDAELDADLRHDIYLAVAWAYQGLLELEDLQRLVQHARRIYPQSAEFMLVSGVLAEAQGGPRSAGAREIGLLAHDPEVFWQAAKDDYERLLSITPNRADARVRLGRVLLELGDQQAAIVQLKRALAASTSLDTTYLAEMLLGRARYESGDASAAIAAFEAAQGMMPECAGPILFRSLIHLPSVVDQSRSTADALTERRVCVDPWWSYDYGSAATLPDLLSALTCRVTTRCRSSAP